MASYSQPLGRTALSTQSEERKHSGSNSSSEHSSGMAVRGTSCSFLDSFQGFFLLKETSGEVEGDRVGRGRGWRRKKKGLWIALQIFLGSPQILGSCPLCITVIQWILIFWSIKRNLTFREREWQRFSVCLCISGIAVEGNWERYWKHRREGSFTFDVSFSSRHPHPGVFSNISFSYWPSLSVLWMSWSDNLSLILILKLLVLPSQFKILKFLFNEK